MPEGLVSLVPGDRVAERSRPGDHTFRLNHPNATEIARMARSVRVGRVTGIREKRSSNGSRILYVDVIWDGRKSPSTHSISRVRRLDAI